MQKKDAGAVLQILYTAMQNAGQDPHTQLLCYLLSEDPVYLPQNAALRALAAEVPPRTLLAHLLHVYFADRTEGETQDAR